VLPKILQVQLNTTLVVEIAFGTTNAAIMIASLRSIGHACMVIVHDSTLSKPTLANNFWSNSQSMTELCGRCPCSQEKGQASFWVLKCCPMHALACLLACPKGHLAVESSSSNVLQTFEKFGRHIFNWN
jgi:hypothetical protein